MLSGAEACKSCRSRQELSNEYLVFTCKIRLRYSRERASQSLPKLAKSQNKVRKNIGSDVCLNLVAGEMAGGGLRFTPALTIRLPESAGSNYKQLLWHPVSESQWLSWAILLINASIWSDNQSTLRFESKHYLRIRAQLLKFAWPVVICSTKKSDY